MQVNLTRSAAHKLSELLDAGLCTRAALIEHLTSPSLVKSYRLTVKPDEDGYIVCPWRTVNCGEVPVSEHAEAVLRDLAQHFRLSPEKRSRESTSMALDAILSGIITSVPTRSLAGPSLHPPRVIRHASTQRPKLALSNEALMGISRLSRSYLPMSTQHAPRGERKTPGYDTQARKPFKQISKMIGTLESFHFMWNDTQSQALHPHVRRYKTCSVSNRLIEFFAAEGDRLGVTPLAGGRRTTLSLASNTLEAIGQGIIIPERLREQLTRVGREA